MPSCMRAPPEAWRSTTGSRCAAPRSKSRVIFSPTTEPIDPPMKLKMNAPYAMGMPSMWPLPVSMASFARVFFCEAATRSG